MDRVRERLFETKALDEMKKNASLLDLRCDPELVLRFKADVNHGGTTATGPRYSSTSDEWKVSMSEFKSIRDSESLTKWLNNNYKSKKSNIFLQYKKAEGLVYLHCKLYFKVEHYGADSIWLKNDLTITPDRNYEPLVAEYFGSEEIHVEPTVDNPHVRPSSFDTYFEVLESKPELNESQLGSFAVEMLRKDTPWINGRFGRFETHEEKLMVPLEFDTTTYSIQFSNPEDISSPIWDLASVFGCQDPWNLEAEELQATLNPLSISSNTYQHKMIQLRDSKDNKQYSLLNRFRLALRGLPAFR